MFVVVIYCCFWFVHLQGLPVGFSFLFRPVAGSYVTNRLGVYIGLPTQPAHRAQQQQQVYIFFTKFNETAARERSMDKGKI